MPRLTVPATSLSYEPPLHGLVDSTPELDFDDDRWQIAGTQMRSEACAEISSWNGDCASWPGGVKPTLEVGDAPEWFESVAHELYVEFTCSTGGGTHHEELKAIAERQLELGSSKALEAELWLGTQGALYTPDEGQALQRGATTVTGTALDYNSGLAAAGQALANCGLGGRGVIHASPFVVGIWMDGGQIREDDTGKLVTVARGDTIIVGSGYPGTGPDGEAITGNSAWIFATGPVAHKLGPINPLAITAEPVVNSSTNEVTVRAVRHGIAVFDPCCHFALELDR